MFLGPQHGSVSRSPWIEPRVDPRQCLHHRLRLGALHGIQEVCRLRRRQSQGHCCYSMCFPLRNRQFPFPTAGFRIVPDVHQVHEGSAQVLSAPKAQDREVQGDQRSGRLHTRKVLHHNRTAGTSLHEIFFFVGQRIDYRIFSPKWIFFHPSGTLGGTLVFSKLP